MQIDEIAYLDQLHETANDPKASLIESGRAKIKFFDSVFLLWPEISKAFEEHKHSL